MNLFLTSSCNERCAFCYAETFFERPDRLAKPESIAALRAHLETYALLVERGAPQSGEPYQRDIFSRLD